LKYFKDTVKEYDLASSIRLNHVVQWAKWREDEGKWSLGITDLLNNRNFEDECDVLVNAMGFLK
jgi:cation diffusion facilitator CzcD-associated flavoprotein CzcO